MGHHHLIVFLKAPRVGQVKTRLARAIGAEAACSAYRRMLDIVLQNIRSLQNVQLRFTPADAAPEIVASLRPGWSAACQGGGDLGDRLSCAVSSAFADGSDRVVVIGVDCPDVQAGDIQSAWAALETHDLVLGPAEDGGYYLIGLRRPEIDLFKGIEWSTSSVLQATLDRAKKLELKTLLLRTLHDIDTAEDLERWKSRNAHGR